MLVSGENERTYNDGLGSDKAGAGQEAELGELPELVGLNPATRRSRGSSYRPCPERSNEDVDGAGVFRACGGGGGVSSVRDAAGAL